MYVHRYVHVHVPTPILTPMAGRHFPRRGRVQRPDHPPSPGPGVGYVVGTLLDDGEERLALAAGAAGGPNLTQIVGWLNVLLDAHASQLLMHAPALAPLTQLGDLARRHVQLSSSVKALKGHLSQATLHGAQPTRPVPPYSVELITL